MEIESEENKQEPKTIFDIFEKKHKKGKIIFITSEKIAIDVDGNGQEIKYNPDLHSNLKVGDEIEI
jgi:hypothetical protein